MIALGAEHDCPVVALVTAMDRPLGRACGNALEVEEAIHALQGEGPPDLMEVTYALGAEMLLLGGAGGPIARRRASGWRRRSRRGAPPRSSRRSSRRRAAIPAVVDDPALLPQAEAIELVRAPRRGFVARVEPRAIGRGIIALGGGRTTMEDAIDPRVGFVITAKPGDWVEPGEPIATCSRGMRRGCARARRR